MFTTKHDFKLSINLNEASISLTKLQIIKMIFSLFERETIIICILGSWPGWWRSEWTYVCELLAFQSHPFGHCKSSMCPGRWWSHLAASVTLTLRYKRLEVTEVPVKIQDKIRNLLFVVRFNGCVALSVIVESRQLSTSAILCLGVVFKVKYHF